MTIHDVSSQLVSLAVDNKLNGIKFSVKSLEQHLRMTFRPEVHLHGGNKYVMEISLPDGGWYIYIIEYAPGEYDYYIPDTREQEKRVIAILH